MPRARRYHLPGYIWHITHRCHQRAFLLKFKRDRRLWWRWLFEAKKRYGLCILNYIATSNHIHLLVKDRGQGEIAQSMQLMAGRTGQAYNRRKGRKGAFWEDRYHATVVDTDNHLRRCLAYIDLNMVRAGAVSHPREWDVSGYREIQLPPERYALVDRPTLASLLGLDAIGALAAAQRQWIDEALQARPGPREPAWSEAIAVGRESFVEDIRSQLGMAVHHRAVVPGDGLWTLEEVPATYK